MLAIGRFKKKKKEQASKKNQVNNDSNNSINNSNSINNNHNSNINKNKNDKEPHHPPHQIVDLTSQLASHIKLRRSYSDSTLSNYNLKLEYLVRHEKIHRHDTKNDWIEPPIDPSLPITMVFTDVQGSTSLWESLPLEMEKCISLHDQCIRDLMVQHNGFEVITEGGKYKYYYYNYIHN